MVMHRPLWGQALWQDLWEVGHQKQITVYHVTGHAPFASPTNDETDTLAKVQWLETMPTCLSGIEVAQWLHCHLLHVGEKTMWSTIKNLVITCHLSRGTGACKTCVVCPQHIQRPVGTTGQVVWG